MRTLAKNMLHSVLLAGVMSFVCCLAPLRAQGDRAAVATAYEQSGDYRSAARLWQSLYQEEPKNENYFLGVYRSLKALDSYNALLEIVEVRIKTVRSVPTMVVYGQVLWKLQRRDEAEKAWDEVLSKATTMQVFADLARIQVESGAFDGAILTYIEARKVLKKQEIFSDELCKLYATVGDVGKGIREVIANYRRYAQLQNAQGRISALLNGDSAVDVIRIYLKEEYEDNGADLAYMRLYEWFLREIRRADEARAIVEVLDARLNANGRELVIFAEAMRAEGNYAVAMKAFSRVMRMGTTSDMAQYAAFGYASCVEANAGTDSSAVPLREVISLYENIVRDYPRTSTAADALLHIAELKERINETADQVTGVYAALRKDYAGYTQAVRATVALANVRLMQDSTQAAHRYLMEALSMRGCTEDIVDEVVFRRAELLLFQGETDSALTAYDSVIYKPESEFANDAIDRTTCIRLMRGDSALLDLFARASKLRYLKKGSEALALWDIMSMRKDNPDVAEIASLNAAESCVELKLYDRALDYCKRIISTSESIYIDRAMVLQARTFMAMGKRQEALNTYEELLRLFPRSIHVREARTVLRQKRN